MMTNSEDNVLSQLYFDLVNANIPINIMPRFSRWDSTP